MNIRIALLLCAFSSFLSTKAQFAPAAGMPGSTAIKADSNCFVAWGTSAIADLGLRNISQPDSGKVSVGSESAVLGNALKNGVLSLGDGGSVSVYFASGIVNQEGFDFAVFENAFNDSFLELAHVEISGDGQNYFRFPSISNTPILKQTESFGATFPENIHNLAGKYRMPYGTPFDISDIDSTQPNFPDVFYYVRVIDVVGSINSLWGSQDSKGNVINDPWPTPFASSGFDLDAIGIIHPAHTGNIEKNQLKDLKIFPRENKITIQKTPHLPAFQIYDATGRLRYQHEPQIDLSRVELDPLPTGIYYLRVHEGSIAFWVP
jgi:hypothetical protein